MPTPPFIRHQKRLAITLAAVAGYVDAYGLLAFNTYLSFMSGNTTQTGASIGDGSFGLAAPSALAIVAFLTGVFLGNLRKHSARPGSASPSRSGPHAGSVGDLAAVGLVLGATCVALHLRLFGPFPAIAIIACAMGVMTSTFSRIGSEPVNLTFVTGALNRIGTHLAFAAMRRPLEDAQSPGDTHASRALLLATIWAGFLCGALLAGFATARFGNWTLMPASVALFAIAGLLATTGVLRSTEWEEH